MSRLNRRRLGERVEFRFSGLRAVQVTRRLLFVSLNITRCEFEFRVYKKNVVDAGLLPRDA